MPFGWLGMYNKFFNPIIILLPVFMLWITLVELMQHYSGRGLADIDDIILNTLGMLSGYFLYKITDWKWSWSTNSLRNSEADV